MDDANTYPYEFLLQHRDTEGLDKNKIISIVKSYSFSNFSQLKFYYSDELDFDKRKRNAQKSYVSLNFDSDEYPILLFDYSLFGNGKSGFFLTNKRLWHGDFLFSINKWSMKINQITKVIAKDKAHGDNNVVNIISDAGKTNIMSCLFDDSYQFAKQFAELLSILKSLNAGFEMATEGNISPVTSMTQVAQSQSTSSNEITKKCQTVAQLHGTQIPDTQEYKIDLSECTEEMISLLPGVGLISAKKFVKFRNQNPESISVEQFLNFLDIHECYREPLRSVLYCKASKKPRGRRVDM